MSTFLEYMRLWLQFPETHKHCLYIHVPCVVVYAIVITDNVATVQEWFLSCSPVDFLLCLSDRNSLLTRE